MEKLDSAAIEFESSSYIDPNGRVFKMDNDIYRAIFLSKTDFFIKLLNEKWYKSLENDGKIIETEITNFTLDGYGIILRHRKLRNITYCFEWAPEMLQDAALLMLEIALEFSNHDLILQDAYPWNITFKNYKPIFIDIGSVAEPTKYTIWQAYDQFCHFFLFPLYLYAAGLFEVAHALSFDYINGIPHKICAKLLPMSYKIIHPRSFIRVNFSLFCSNLVLKFNFEDKIKEINKKLISRINISKVRERFLKSLFEEVKSSKFPLPPSNWTKYYMIHDSLLSLGEKNKKLELVKRILENLRPNSILDIGCNLGRYSILAAKQGIDVLAFDNDRNCISQLYNYAKKEKLNITPFIMDVLNPSPEFGWCLKQFPSAIKRFKTEMVFALAIMHHMIFKQKQDFERVVKLFDAFTTKWLLVEFIPKEDKLLRSLLTNKNNNFEWYTLGNLLTVLEKYFKEIEIFESFPEGRKLILCER